MAWEEEENMKKSRSRKLLAVLLGCLMVIGIMPATASADETGPVAKIGSTEYATLDAAVAEAGDGETITVLKNCSTEGLNLKKNLTIEGYGDSNPVIKFDKSGVALWGKNLTFKDCQVTMNDIGSTPYTEWTWMAICASKDASLTLDNVDMTMDGANAGNAHAIYFCSNNKLDIKNYSNLKISNYAQDALEWDGGDGGYNVNIVDSTFVADHNRSGFTGTFVATIKNSDVQVINSTGNGSNGSNFYIEDSKVNFSDNGSHGLSAGKLEVSGSELICNNNGGNGIHTTNGFDVKNISEVTVKNNGCTISSKWTIPGAVYIGKGGSIDDSCTLTIEENKGSGILLKGGGFTASEGVTLSIKKNEAVKLGYGGGINVYPGAILNLPDGVALYNNHAPTAGDDVYVAPGGTAVIPKIGSDEEDWVLDGEPDCKELINGWFDDSENVKESDHNRWKAHGDDSKTFHYVKTDAGKKVAENSPVALKAAHGLINVDVKKVWKLDNGGQATDSVTAVLTKDGEAYDKVVLSADNHWEHTFEYLTDSCEWYIEEEPVEGFEAYVIEEVTNDGFCYTIWNDDIDQTAVAGGEGGDDAAAKTGDNTNLMLLLALVLASCIGGAAVVLKRKKI